MSSSHAGSLQSQEESRESGDTDHSSGKYSTLIGGHKIISISDWLTQNNFDL